MSYPHLDIIAYVQRSINPLGNDHDTYNPSIAELMLCYQCKGNIEIYKSTPTIPLVGIDFSNDELNQCWNPNFAGVSETLALPCSTKCFTRAFVVMTKETDTNKLTISVGRGCIANDNLYQTPYFNINSTVELCTYKDGTLCNNIEPIMMNEFRLQVEIILECLVCDTGFWNKAWH